MSAVLTVSIMPWSSSNLYSFLLWHHVQTSLNTRKISVCLRIYAWVNFCSIRRGLAYSCSVLFMVYTASLKIFMGGEKRIKNLWKKPFYTVYKIIKSKNMLWKRSQSTPSNQKKLLSHSQMFSNPFQCCWWLLILGMTSSFHISPSMPFTCLPNIYAWLNFPFEQLCLIET